MVLPWVQQPFSFQAKVFEYIFVNPGYLDVCHPLRDYLYILYLKKKTSFINNNNSNKSDVCASSYMELVPV